MHKAKSNQSDELKPSYSMLGLAGRDDAVTPLTLTMKATSWVELRPLEEGSHEDERMAVGRVGPGCQALRLGCSMKTAFTGCSPCVEDLLHALLLFFCQTLPTKAQKQHLVW